MTESEPLSTQVDWQKTVLVFLAASSWVRFRRACFLVEKLIEDKECKMDPKLCRMLQRFIGMAGRKVFDNRNIPIGTRQQPRKKIGMHVVYAHYRREVMRYFSWNKDEVEKKVAFYRRWWDKTTSYPENKPIEFVFFNAPEIEQASQI